MSDVRTWLSLVRAPGLGPVRCAKLLAHFSDPAVIPTASAADLAALGVPQTAINALHNPDLRELDNDLAWLAQPARTLVTVHDPAYPRRLFATGRAPIALFVQGDVRLLNEPQLAIVGTRNPTPTGRSIAEDFARELTQSGLVITSGLALGIDAAAHQGALNAGGSTIAVLGTGPDRIYPARNRDLACRIVEHGALVSEFPPGTPVRAEHFPQRNRLISGLALGTLVVEAARQSGSLITARLATEQGREVFAVPGSIRNPAAQGCHWLIRQGAKLVENVTDILEELTPQLRQFIEGASTDHHHANPAVAGSVPQQSVSNPVDLDAQQQELLTYLDNEPIAVDSLVERTGLTVDVVSSMLLILELHGYIQAIPGGRYRRASV